MRWIEMRGPIRPIIRKMAGYYAARSPCEVDDLMQEAELFMLRRPDRPPLHVAFSAMTNLVDRERRHRRRIERAPVRPRRGHELDALLDVGPRLAVLSDREREVCRLRYWQDMKLREIARSLRINQSTAVRALARALHKMRALESAP